MIAVVGCWWLDFNVLNDDCDPWKLDLKMLSSNVEE